MADRGESSIGLLLSDAEEYMPVLEDGLDADALQQAQPPARGPRGVDAMNLDAPERDPNELPAQRWGVIAPAGERGDQMLSAIDALLQHRGAQQGAPPRVYRVESSMDASAAMRWKNGVLRDEEVPEEERPRYLMILGDLDEVSLETQQVLANGSFVGRLQVPSLAGFRGYAEKVVATERGPDRDGETRALYYTVQDGTTAVNTGYCKLVQPCVEMNQRWAADGDARARVVEVPYSDWGPEKLLEEAGQEAPAVMLSLSHGLGAPRRGWRSPDHQRALQGALSMGMEDPLTAETIASVPFLPGGVWACVACFSAGTPSTSVFYPWLSLLAEQGASEKSLREVLRGLPGDDARPFVAALPQAALANPRGPLALVGHIDLAWTFGFTDARTRRSRASRMFSMLRVLLSGSRAGVALDALMRAYREVNDELMAGYQLQRDALARAQPDPTDLPRRGALWMSRNDLRGYVLLGDPAARLSIARDEPRGAPRRSTTAPGPREQARIELGPAVAPPTDTSPPRLETFSSAPELTTAPRVEEPAPPRPREPDPPPPRSPSAPRRDDAPVVYQAPVDAHEPPPRDRGIERHLDAPPGYHPPPRYQNMPTKTEPTLGVMDAARRLELQERVVLAFLRGDESPRRIAARVGVSLDDLYDMARVYREAGRYALARRG